MHAGEMTYAASVVDLIGNTPLVRLRRVTAGIVPDPGPMVLAKVEYLNPGGSVKDRIGCYMLEKAEREGRIKPGGNCDLFAEIPAERNTTDSRLLHMRGSNMREGLIGRAVIDKDDFPVF